MAQRIKVLAVQVWRPECIPKTSVKAEERMDCTSHYGTQTLLCFVLFLFLRQKEAREMAQWLRTLIALGEHQELVPRNHTRELTTA